MNGWVSGCSPQPLDSCLHTSHFCSTPSWSTGKTTPVLDLQKPNDQRKHMEQTNNIEHLAKNIGRPWPGDTRYKMTNDFKLCVDIAALKVISATLSPQLVLSLLPSWRLPSPPPSPLCLLLLPALFFLKDLKNNLFSFSNIEQLNHHCFIA